MICVSDALYQYYGAQGVDGHDRICLATSRDGKVWTDECVVFQVEGLNHVNDPSVVRVAGRWKMFYTRAEIGVTDTIGLAESDNGRDWVDRGEVFGPGEPESWNSLLVGRPSVLFDDGKFRMWYDGRSSLPASAPDKQAIKSSVSQRSVGYAESADGLTWKRHPRPVMHRDSGAVHVSQIDGSFVMLIESRKGTLWATSADGIRWQHQGLLADAGPFAPHGHVTPFLCKVENQFRLFFGAAMGTRWNENQLAWMDVDLPVQSTTKDLAADVVATLTRNDPPGPDLPLLARVKVEAASLAGRQQPDVRPNIVMIFSDDQRQDAVGYAGNSAITTPHLDALAKQGMVFRNCFVNTSICAINRANLLSGQYPGRHGIRDFFETFTHQQLRESVPGRLRDAGYQTAFFGKWGIGDTSEKTHLGAAVFDYWAGQPKQTNYFHESDCRHVRYDGFSRSSDDLCDCPADKRGHAGVQVRVGKETLSDPIHHDAEIIPMHAQRFLEGRDPDRPFCMMLFFKSPHGPFSDWDPATREYTAGKTMPIPLAATKANAQREPTVVQSSLGWSAGQTLLDNPARHQASVSDYYRSISSMDMGVGRIMAELHRRGLDQNTVVLFTSDNGHFSGEHGLGGKWLMYEPSLRVPGFLCDLRKPLQEAVSDELVITTDFSATILALAGLPIPDTISGLDLTALTDNEEIEWRDDMFYDHPYGHNGKIPTTIGVRTRTHTYTRYTSETPPFEQLFDNQTDPDQLNNLATDPEFNGQLLTLRRRCDQLQEEVQ
ncbi:Arylsulfatase [Pirellulimonas nuda]|uniref:Arylsulfatase n=1 Tax=Pirellulimonas nuda TaxID=2528009 RepID=A0A518DCX0_9BACT|nr:Arylsulfatase [Pirellulimonas nuda]